MDWRISIDRKKCFGWECNPRPALDEDSFIVGASGARPRYIAIFIRASAARPYETQILRQMRQIPKVSVLESSTEIEAENLRAVIGFFLGDPREIEPNWPHWRSPDNAETVS
jgi:hypothetical protein